MKKSILLLLPVFFVSFFTQEISAQSFSINTTGAAAAPSAMLDVTSTVKGVLIPRMSKAQKSAIAAPATGLLIFQNAPDSIGFHYYDGSQWVWLSSNSPILDTVNWKTHGNLGLTDATSFLGNQDDIPLNFRVNNEKVGRFDRFRYQYFIGRGAGNNAGVAHIAIGDSSGNASAGTFPGVYIGYRSGVKNQGTSNNVFLGPWSGENNTTGGGNVFVGTVAGQNNTTGSNNTSLGSSAYATANTSNYTAIGYSAGGTWSNAANTVEIGNSLVTKIGGAVPWSVGSDKRI